MTRFISAAIVSLTMGLAPLALDAGPSPIAEVICAPDVEMRQRLTRQYRAALLWQGLRSPDEVVELWEDRRGEWVIVMAYSSGKMCIVAMGESLQAFSGRPEY